MKLCALSTLLVIASVCIAENDIIKNEKHLYRDLMADYESSVRPIHEDKSKPVTVNVGFTLVQILELDLVYNSIEISAWHRLTWNDPQLSWNASKYPGVNKISLHPSRIWMPDIVNFNAYGPEQDLHDILAIAFPDGTVMYIPPKIIRSSCPMNVAYFPFDKQTCAFKYGSWVHDGNQVDPHLEDGATEVDMSYHTPHPGWTVLSTEIKREENKYDCCPEPYPSVTFTLNLQRNAAYTSYILLGPVGIFMFLLPFLFLSPPHSSTKVNMGLFVLLCSTISLTMLTSFLPSPHFYLPVIGKFYMGSFCMTAISLILAILTTNMASRRTPPPQVLKKIFVDILGRVCCISRDTDVRYDAMSDKNNVLANDGNGSMNDDHSFVPPSASADDWYKIAMVMDRLLFFLFLVVFCLLGFIMSGLFAG